MKVKKERNSKKLKNNSKNVWGSIVCRFKKTTSNNDQGITLISLVITIIVLIILASVSIYLSLGNNGIFNKAKYAKEEYINSQENEKEQINTLYSQTLIATNEGSKITISIEDLNKIIDQRINALNNQVLKYEEKYKYKTSTMSQGDTKKTYVLEEDGIYYVEVYAGSCATATKLKTAIQYNNGNISGNYNTSEATWELSSCNAIINAKKGESISGYFYTTKNITSGEFHFKIVKIQ